MNQPVKIAFASGSEDLIPTLIERMRALGPDVPLYIVSEFPVEGGRWVPYHVKRSFGENYARCRAAIGEHKILFAGLILQPRMPYWSMRLIPLVMAPLRVVAFNENLDHFMLRPRAIPAILRHMLWRTKNWFRWEFRPGGLIYTWLWRLRHPSAFERPVVYRAALAAGLIRWMAKLVTPPRTRTVPGGARPDGISVVIPSRDGRALLERCLPAVYRELDGAASEVIVVDNGSTDSTARWLAASYPDCVVDENAGALSFAVAVNRGIRRARYSHVCLLNNDMLIEAGFFRTLRDAFDRTPDLFAATAQILFPAGRRREETGKAVMSAPSSRKLTDFPVRCDEPAAGEDGTYVLYGSGGCTLYDAAKFGDLGGLREIYTPAYVEDLDLGYRAWRAGWPTVFVSGARVVHEHRATSSRYYSPAELDRVLERNYLRFLAASVASPPVFRRLWREAIVRLNLMAAQMKPPVVALPSLRDAVGIALDLTREEGPRPAGALDEEGVLALTDGSVAVFPGRRPSGRPVALVVSPYPPFPLAHGGAVRMYNLMRRAVADVDQVLVCFVEQQTTPPEELLDICVEIVQVHRAGSHAFPGTDRPDVVEEFDSPPFHAALRQTVEKWKPFAAQLEYTQMAQYAADCQPARTILVEHDITWDLYRQLLAQGEDWELRRQFVRWLPFETNAWRQVDCVVTMSEQDRRLVRGARAVTLANGVDLDRFRPSEESPDERRLLFIGSFAHLPNVLAVEFFLRDVWPLLHPIEPVLHVIAGSRHRYYLDLYREKAAVRLDQPRIEVEDFVADVRPAYRRAAVVIAPLVASAGTNIKILEAMAMGKAIVSTPAGINGLDLDWGRDAIIARTGAEIAHAILGLLENPSGRTRIEVEARRTVELRYDWDTIAASQRRLYASLR